MIMKKTGWYSDEMINHFKEGVSFKSEDYETVDAFIELT